MNAMNLDARLVSLVLAFVALAFTQWLFFPVYILVLAPNGPILALLRL